MLGSKVIAGRWSRVDQGCDRGVTRSNSSAGATTLHAVAKGASRQGFYSSAYVCMAGCSYTEQMRGMSKRLLLYHPPTHPYTHRPCGSHSVDSCMQCLFLLLLHPPTQMHTGYNACSCYNLETPNHPLTHMHTGPVDDPLLLHLVESDRGRTRPSVPHHPV
jgi:hypothetical protein